MHRLTKITKCTDESQIWKPHMHMQMHSYGKSSSRTAVVSRIFWTALLCWFKPKAIGLGLTCGGSRLRSAKQASACRLAGAKQGGSSRSRLSRRAKEIAAASRLPKSSS